MGRSAHVRIHELTRKTLSIAITFAMLSSFMAPAAAVALPPLMPITAAFSSFSAGNVGGLDLTGSAALSGSAIRLTPAEPDMLGSAFLKQKVHLSNGGAFSTHFAFRLSGPGADGFAFIIREGAGSTAGGGYLGYSGTPGASMAVEFDPWANLWDANSNHVGLDQSGNVMGTDPGFVKDPGFDLDDGGVKYVWIEYMGLPSNLIEIRISETDDRSSAVTIVNNVGGAITVLPYGATEGDVWVGFTGATGGYSMTQDILSWQFDSTYHDSADPLIGADTMRAAEVTMTVAPSSIATGTTSLVCFTAKGADGNPFVGETITVTAPDGGTLSAPSVTTDASGEATATFTAPSAPRKAYDVRGVTSLGLVAEGSIIVGHALPVVDVQSGSTSAYPGLWTDVAPSATITDEFETKLQGALVRILDPEVGLETLSGGGPGNVLTESGTVLTMTGEGTLADYANRLSWVGYQGTPATATRRIEFSVFDGIDWSVPVVKTVAMAPLIPLPTRVTGTVRASTDATWTQGVDADGNARGSKEGYLSATGRYVVFYTGNDLVAEDTNGHAKRGQDWYVKDTLTGAARLVSVAVDGEPSNSDRPYDTNGAAVSADGRYVAFADFSSNLIESGFQAPPMGVGAALTGTTSDTNEVTDVFYRDMLLGVTTRISVDAQGGQGTNGSRSPVMSDDGRFVAFRTGSALVEDDTNGETDIYLRDMLLGTIRRVSVATDGSQGDGGCDDPAISGDGRFIAFQSFATDLVAGDTNGEGDIFLHDTRTGETTRANLSATGQQAEDYSRHPSVSGDGRYVAFESQATTLVAGDNNGEVDVFVRDRQAGTTVCASLDALGAFGTGGSDPEISADGRYVAFASSDGRRKTKDVTAARVLGGLVPGDLNGYDDVLVRDMVKGVTTVVSISRSRGMSNDESWGPEISADGLKVAYTSDASNLVAGDTNDATDVFVATLAAPELPLTGVSVGRPWTRWIVRRNSRALVYGYLSTWHKRGTYPVTLYCYHFENGAWVLRKTAAVKAGASSRSRRTKYAGYVRLPLRGRWKIVAAHAHAGYQVDYSGARYFWVR